MWANGGGVLSIIVIVVICLLLARGGSYVLPAGWWYSVALAAFGVPVMIWVGLSMTGFLSTVDGSGTGFIWTIWAALLFPFAVYYYRRERQQRQMNDDEFDSPPAPEGAPLDALKETQAWKDAEQTVAKAFREQER